MGTRPGNLEDRSVLTKVNADPGSLEIVRKQAPYPQERLLLSSLLSLFFLEFSGPIFSRLRRTLTGLEASLPFHSDWLRRHDEYDNRAL
jgi:hypothetical protein